MATINYAFADACAGGEHVGIDVSLNGGAIKHGHYSASDIRQPIGEFTNDQLEVAALIIMKLHFAGQTGTQIKNALQAVGGVTVTI